MNSARRLLILALALIASATVSAQQWPQWRGPNRDGHVPAAAVPKVWPPTLAKDWSIDVGGGYSSPVVHEGRIYLHSRQGEEEIAWSIDLATGKPLWRHADPAPFTKNKYATQMGKGPHSTPVVSAGRVYTFGVKGLLTCRDATTGAQVWHKDFSSKVDTTNLFTGTAMSPAVDGARLIVHVGDDKQGQLLALDAATGKEIWSLAGDGPGYASPIFATYAGVKQIITMTAKSVIGVAADAGKLLWTIPFPDEWNENIITPIQHGQRLIVAGVRKGSLSYDIARNGDAWAPKLAWHKPDLPMYMSSPVLDGDVLYGMSSRRKGQLVCVDAITGDVRWATEGRAGTNSAVLLAGGHLVVLTTDGDLIVAMRDPAKYQEVRRYKVADHPSWTYPILLGNRLVIKDDEKLTLWKVS